MRQEAAQQPTEPTPPNLLTSLAKWSVTHTRSIFEAASHREAMQAVDDTFSNDVEAYMNGVRIDVEAIKAQVMALRQSSKRGLRVRWNNIVEVPHRPGLRAAASRPTDDIQYVTYFDDGRDT